MTQINGTVQDGYGKVADAFGANFDDHGELGAAFALYVDGDCKVDIWAGVADGTTGRTWDEDTLQLVFSTTKGAAATCVAQLVEAGKIGYDAPVASPITCIQPADFVPGTDVLVLRRVSTQLTALASLDSQQIYVQNNNDWTDANNPIVNVGVVANFTLLAKDGVTSADLRQYQLRIYYVSPCHRYAAGATACSAGADGGRPVPTLRMLELTAGAGGARLDSIALAEGVENLQIDYGVDSAGQGAAQDFVTNPAGLADWGNVTEVKLNLLVRNPQATPGHVDAKTYNLGLSGAVTPAGAFKRHVYTQHVRLNNLGAAREAP